MSLDRNKSKDGVGRYAVIDLRKNTVNFGEVGSDGEFFVLMLKDKYSREALLAYAIAAKEDGHEWAEDVFELAKRAGYMHPKCKRPD